MRNDVKCEITEETHNLVLTEKRVFDLPFINSGEKSILWYNPTKGKIPPSLFQNCPYTKLKCF
jgi:hypothetical protein